ncbi:MAG: hypothetical protein ACLPPV_03380 [Candidatus Korobacteraceae bacterium]
MPKGSKKTAAAKVPVALYWVSTADHDEDWFIFANSTRSAAKFHADYEGYDPRETAAELILEAPDTEGPFPRHAQIDDLTALGFEILKGGDHGRSVKYGDRTFVEGHLDSLMAEIDDNNSETAGEGRPRGTKSSWLKTNLD